MDIIIVPLGAVVVITVWLGFLKIFKKKEKPKSNDIPQSVSSDEDTRVKSNISSSSIETEIEQKLQNLENEKIWLKHRIEELTDRAIALEKTLHSTTKSNNSLELQIKELNNQIKNLKAASSLLRSENATFQKKIKELEVHKKALVQELGGAIGREDLEYATWDLVLQTTQLLIKERDQAVKENESFRQSNEQLKFEVVSKNDEINHLKTIIFDRETEIKKLKFNTNTFNDEQHFNNLNNQLFQKETELRALNEKLNTSHQVIASLKEQVQSQSLHSKKIEQEKLDLEKNIKNLPQQIKQQELEINKTVQNLQNQIKIQEEFYKSRMQNLLEENEHLKKEIVILQSDYTFTGINLSFDHLDDSLDLFTEVANLFYFVQEYFNFSGLECIDSFSQSQQVYFWLIRQLYVVNALLAYRVLDLEDRVANAPHVGKALCWYSRAIKEELNMILNY